MFINNTCTYTSVCIYRLVTANRNFTVLKLKGCSDAECHEIWLISIETMYEERSNEL